MSQLDFYFPFFVFFYGILMIFMVDNPTFLRLQRQYQGNLFGGRFANLSTLGRREAKFLWFVVIFSGLWAAQNLLISV